MRAVEPGEIKDVIFRVNSYPYHTGVGFKVATDCVKKLACLNVTFVQQIVGFKDLKQVIPNAIIDLRSGYLKIIQTRACLHFGTENHSNYFELKISSY